MFNLFKKKEDPDRKQLRLEFEEMISGITKQPKAKRMAVGHSINMANSIFYQRFSSVENFIKLPRPEQMEYVQSLLDMQEKLAGFDPSAMIGIHLHGKWVVALVENDKELIIKFTEGLSILSKEGNLSGQES